MKTLKSTFSKNITTHSAKIFNSNILNIREMLQVRGGGDDDDAPGEPVKDVSAA
jgi:hypothetical protein